MVDIMKVLLSVAFLANLILAVSSTSPASSCGGDKNAVSGCGNCNPTCENYNSTEPRICPLYCKVDGCNCKPGFVLDTNLGKCIRPENCPSSCGGDKNAVSGCGNCNPTCENYKPQICPQYCKADGCNCKPGFVLDTNLGKCVRPKDCSCKGEHELYDTCPPTCPPTQSCDSLGKPYNCPLQTNTPKCGKPGCRCEENYCRNNDGICVLQDKYRECDVA